MARLPLSFYRRPDVVAISRELLGMHLLVRVPGEGITGGRIVETEAYAGPDDRASHAYGNRRTARTEVMFRAGGVAYVFLCYGMHAMLNVVTGRMGVPHAILIRALEPTHGTARMLARRGRKSIDRGLTGGPGRLACALGVDTSWTGVSLVGNRIWIEDRGDRAQPSDIVASPRVGVDYAGADARIPWRFRIGNSKWTSLPA
jgi:DNA-3-methyladenine glycosylase